MPLTIVWFNCNKSFPQALNWSPTKDYIFGDSSRNLRPTDIWFNGATANGYRVQPIYKKVYIR